MLKWIVAWLGVGVTFAAIDAVWLTTMADRLYRPVIGSIMAPKPDLAAAVAFYVVMLSGVVFFAVAPALKGGGLGRAALNGAVLGFVAYATYDLTNQATLSVWSTRLTLIDIAWGTVLTAVAASAGFIAARMVEAR